MQKPESVVVEDRLLDGLLATLRDLPGVQVDLGEPAPPDGPGRGHDAEIRVRVDGKAATLLVESRKALYPRDARQVLWRIRELGHGWSRPAEGRQPVFFLIAESISPGARNLLKKERVGYYDSGGSLFLPDGDIYVYVDKPPPKGLSKSIRSLFSGRRAHVLHAVLMRHREWFGVKEVASWARVSPATASQVLTELEKFDWIVSRGQGPGKERHLQEPGALLDAWVNQLPGLRPLSMRRYFVPSARGEGLVDRFAEACVANKAEYAMTHEAAAQRYAPFLSNVAQVRCRLLGDPAADGAIRALDARRVDEGANLAVIKVKSPDELQFRENVNGVWLASAVQVYLDLMRSEGRAKDMAKHLRQERIGF